MPLISKIRSSHETTTSFLEMSPFEQPPPPTSRCVLTACAAQHSPPRLVSSSLANCRSTSLAQSLRLVPERPRPDWMKSHVPAFLRAAERGELRLADGNKRLVLIGSPGHSVRPRLAAAGVPRAEAPAPRGLSVGSSDACAVAHLDKRSGFSFLFLSRERG